MFLANGKKALLRKYNRDSTNDYYDDQEYKEQTLKVIPYKIDDLIKFGISSCPEATGFFQVDRRTDIRKGDQIVFRDNIYTVLKVQEAWLFNRVENLLIHVK